MASKPVRRSADTIALAMHSAACRPKFAVPRRACPRPSQLVADLELATPTRSAPDLGYQFLQLSRVTRIRTAGRSSAIDIRYGNTRDTPEPDVRVQVRWGSRPGMLDAPVMKRNDMAGLGKHDRSYSHEMGGDRRTPAGIRSCLPPVGRVVLGQTHQGQMKQVPRKCATPLYPCRCHGSRRPRCSNCQTAVSAWPPE